MKKKLLLQNRITVSDLASSMDVFPRTYVLHCVGCDVVGGQSTV
jgi:hypothetical protein